MANGLPIPVAKEQLAALARTLEGRVRVLKPGSPVAEVMAGLKQMQDILKMLPWSYEGVRNITAAEEARTLGWTVSDLLMDCVCTDKDHTRPSTGLKAAGPAYITTGPGRDAALAKLQGIARTLARLP
jgi:hypothetical protein